MMMHGLRERYTNISDVETSQGLFSNAPKKLFEIMHPQQVGFFTVFHVKLQ